MVEQICILFHHGFLLLFVGGWWWLDGQFDSVLNGRNRSIFTAGTAGSSAGSSGLLGLLDESVDGSTGTSSQLS